MILFRSYYVTYGALAVILFLLLIYCRKIRQIYKGFPVVHFIPYLLYCHVFRKIPKDMSFSRFVTRYGIDKCKQYMKEGLCMSYLFTTILVIFSEEAVKVFANEKSAADKPDEYEMFEDVVGPGLVTRNGEKWRKHRKMLNPVFNLGMLKDKFPLFNEHAAALVKDLKQMIGKPSFDLSDFIKCHYYNSLSESVFGLKQTEANRSENLKYFRLIEHSNELVVYRIAHPWLHWKFMLNFFPNGQKILHKCKEIFNFTRNMVDKMKNHVTSNKTTDADCFSTHLRKSFTYILLQHHLKDPSFTFEDLRGHVNTFMNAGFDTVSFSTMWCLFLLGLYPEVQEKAYNEVQSAPENYISYEDCCSFTYLESVILETFRLYPTIPLFARQLNEDVQYGKHKVPKGTVICFFTYLLHRNPDMYPDPENFDPDRFLDSKMKKSWSYIPFAEGNRNCIGKKYALLEMKIFLAYILRNFKITSLDRREDIELCWSIVLKPEKPFRMHLEPRSRTMDSSEQCTRTT